MPALALTDLANVFGMVKFYQAARDGGRQADHRLRRLDHATRPSATSRIALLLLVPVARGLSAAVRAAVARLSRQPAPRPRRAAKALVRGRRHRRADRAVGRAATATSARRCCRATRGGAAQLAREWAALFPDALLPRAAARRARREDDALRRRPRVRARRPSSALPVVATHPVQFLQPRGFPRARGARVHRRGLRAGRPAPAARASPPSSTSRRRPRWRRLFADLPEALANTRRDRPALQPRASSSARAACREFPTPDGVSARGVLRERARRRARARGSQRSIPTRRARARARRATASGSSSRSTTIVQMGFAGYFLIVADFINWAKAQRRAGRARAAARAPGRSSPTRSASPTSIRCATTCCSSAS